MNRRQLQALVEAQTRGREEQRRQNAAQDGHPAPKRQRPSHWPVGVDSALEMALVTRLEHAGLPLGEGQYRFVPGRLFRFDRAWPDHGMVAVEIQGGLWVNGAHSRGSGVERDCVKLSIAAALGWRGVPFPDSVAAGRAGLAGAAGFLAGCPLPRATSMDDAHAWAHLGGRFARRPSVVVVLVAVNPAASLGISLTVTLMRTRNIFEVERRAKLPERRLFIVLQAVNVTIDDVGDPDTTVHRVPIDVDDGDMPRPPSLTDGLARHADVQDLRIIEDREVEAGLFWQSPCALGERDGRQRQHALNQRVRRHHARPRFPSARRSRYTICALRLRSSSLAHSLSAACRSGGNRRKNFTTASAMSTVYCTLLPPCSHYSRLLLYRWQNDTIRSITREDCQ